MHGDVSISIDDRLMIIDGVGPGNTEAVLKYQQLAKQYRPQLSDKHWASLVRLKGEPFLIPEAKAMMAETIQFAMSQKLAATAVVFQDIKHEQTVQFFWESIYVKTGIPHAFFKQEDDARAWLYEQIAVADAN